MRLSFILFPPFLTQTVSARREIARTAVKRWSFSHTQPKILGAMFWILRRTRFSNAAALFNSINNNNSSESRPARKDYNKLTGDDQHLLQDKEDIHQETSQQSQNEDVKNKNEKLDNEAIFRDELTNNELIDTDSESTFTDIDLDREDFTDDSDYDEALTCNVCDRSFASPKQLSSHKQKKRHFGCSACDSLFPSLMALEHHKEEFEHWSGDEDVTCTDSEDDEDETVVTEECERLL